jgi:hypothetical protein
MSTLWLILIALFFPAQGDAYLDPGTGGLLYQMGFALFSLLMGLFLVPVRYVKAALRKIAGIFKKA